MRVHPVSISLGALALLGLSALAVARTDPAVSFTDLGAAGERSGTYDAAVAPVAPASIKEFRIPVTHQTIEIADGVTYTGWTFGGTVPGPVIRVREGDLVRVRLVNQSPMPHSIDFHSARIPMNVAFRTIAPNDSLSFEFTARDPGAYLVHCGTPPVLLHIMQGMYLPIIVDPRGGWPGQVDREFVVVQSEFYAARQEAGPAQPDFQAALARQPSFVTFNGRAFQYQANPLRVDLGDRVRFFVVNAGPSFDSDFHVVGAVFDRVFPDGNPANMLRSVQTWTVPAGGGAVFETEFADGASGEGVYAFVTHAFAEAAKGAVGLVKVGEPQVAHAGH
jgi:nitrite reductase (NO-forming)